MSQGGGEPSATANSGGKCTHQEAQETPLTAKAGVYMYVWCI